MTMKELSINGTEATATVDDVNLAAAVAANLVQGGAEFSQQTTVDETGVCEWTFRFPRKAVPLLSGIL